MNLNLILNNWVKSAKFCPKINKLFQFSNFLCILYFLGQKMAPLTPNLNYTNIKIVKFN